MMGVFRSEGTAGSIPCKPPPTLFFADFRSSQPYYQTTFLENNIVQLYSG